MTGCGCHDPGVFGHQADCAHDRGPAGTVRALDRVIQETYDLPEPIRQAAVTGSRNEMGPVIVMEEWRIVRRRMFGRRE